ncbi:MAG: hypothetical protein ACKOUU_11235 [Acinetobacter tjernbergiae]
MLSSQLIDTFWSLGVHVEPYLTATTLGSILLGAINNAKGGYIATCILVKTDLYKDTYIQVLQRLDMLTCKDECGKTDISFITYRTTGRTYDKNRRENQLYRKKMRKFLPEYDCINWANQIRNGG